MSRKTRLPFLVANKESLKTVEEVHLKTMSRLIF
jgi:hypothetical protein